jgi:hypothetical protein
MDIDSLYGQFESLVLKLAIRLTGPRTTGFGRMARTVATTSALPG